MLPLNLPELEVSGLALVTAIKDCTPIADGEGSVVTARFVTREVHVVASVDVLGADGTVETITGTTIHPVWSVDRQEWVPLAELAQGERLQGLDGLAVVLGVSLSRVSQPVYNIEVHGEHVYQVGDLGLVVHNNSAAFIRVASGHGGKILPASTLRTIRKGEKVDDLVRELAQATYESGGLEHAIVSLRNGTRIIVRGGSGGIELGDDVKRVIMHTHPRTTGHRQRTSTCCVSSDKGIHTSMSFLVAVCLDSDFNGRGKKTIWRW
jgi:hypothetical protein